MGNQLDIVCIEYHWSYGSIGSIDRRFDLTTFITRRTSNAKDRHHHENHDTTHHETSLLHPPAFYHTSRTTKGRIYSKCDHPHASNSGRTPSYHTDVETVPVYWPIYRSNALPSTQKNWCPHAQTHLSYLTCARSLQSPFSQDLSLLLEPDHTLRGNERHKGTILENGVSFGVLNPFVFFGYSYLRSCDLIFAFSRVFLAYPSSSLHRLPSYLFIGGRIVGSGQGVVLFET
jgi:hypothetical protein